MQRTTTASIVSKQNNASAILSKSNWWAVCCIPLIATWLYVCAYNLINWIIAAISGDQIPFFLITTIPCNSPFPEWKFLSQIVLEILRLFIGFLGYWYIRNSLHESKNILKQQLVYGMF